MSALEKLAGAAVTALIKSDPSALAIAGGKEALDWLFDYLRGETSQLGQLIAKVEGGLVRELRGRSDLDPAIANATTLFETYGLSAGELVDLNLDPKHATQKLIERGRGMLGPNPQKQKGAIGLCCTRIVPRVHQLLLNDPAVIASLQPAIFQALLKQREAIGKLPDTIGASLRAQFGRYLVIDPTEVWRPGLPDIYLLRAEYAVVRFHEQRRGEVDRLLAWCESDPPLAARVMTGPGGTGKTRLMIELGKEARRRGWRAGFLHREVPPKPSWELDGLVDGARPLLLVVDYAETRRDVLVPILRRLAMAGGGIRARVVLLAREVGDWWRRLQEDDPKLQEILDDTLVPVERLVPIAAPVHERQGILIAAAVAFARKLELKTPEAGDLDLSGDHFANALFLHIAGLAVAVGDPAREEKALLDFVLKRERRQWRENLKAEELWGDVDEATVAQVLALVTLAAGIDDGAGARHLLERAPKLAGVLPARRDRLIEMLHRLYPGERFLEPVRPDLLGEHLVDQALAAEDRLLEAALQDDAAVPPALTVLTRLAKRRREARRWLEQAFAGDLERLAAPAIAVAIETGDPVGPVLAAALERQPVRDPSRLEPLITEQTTALREVGVVVLEQVWDRIQRVPQPWPKEVKTQAAQAASDFAHFLSEIGRWEAALVAAEKAVSLYRQLAVARPAAFAPGLALALNNLAKALFGLGWREAAVAEAKKAVRLYRRLPNPFTPDLALSLSNLGFFLRELGRWEEALKAATEAVWLWRTLVQARPDLSTAGLTAGLAGSFNNLAILLSDLGQPQRALMAAEEAVRLRRELAAARPDAFTPDLAASLNTLANAFSDLGRREAALAAAEEAVRLCRTLAAARPDAFTPDLAASLNNLSGCLSDLGRREEALAAAEEAVAIYRELAAARPDAFTPNLAASLNNLATRLSGLGRREEALAAAEEAAGLYRELAAARPAAFTPDLALSLSVLADRLEEADRLAEAVQHDEEALRALTPYFLRFPQGLAHRARPIAGDYLRHCEKLAREPDGELLAPIAEALMRLQEEGGPADQARE